MIELYPGTVLLAEALRAHGVAVAELKPRSTDEDADLIWLARYSDGGLCEGEYIFVEQCTYADSDRVDLWIGHNSADVCGGHPTYWSKFIPAGDNKAIQALIAEHWPKDQ